MYHTSGRSGVLTFDQIKRILCGLAAVHNDRKIYLFCKLHLLFEPFLLKLVGLFIPVIIKTDLADCDCFFHGAHFSEMLHLHLIQFTDMIRMHADCRIDMRITHRKLHTVLCPLKTCTYVYNTADTLLFHRGEQAVSVFVKCLIIIMSVTVKNHTFFSS